MFNPVLCLLMSWAMLLVSLRNVNRCLDWQRFSYLALCGTLFTPLLYQQDKVFVTCFDSINENNNNKLSELNKLLLIIMFTRF